MTRLVILTATVLAAGPLLGCLTTTASVPVWDHFDGCQERMAFHEWVTCAKQNRQACEATHNCASNTDTVIAYADGLDQQVQHREITDAEAKRRFATYRADREVAQSNSARSAQDRAQAAASAPGMCSLARSAGAC